MTINWKTIQDDKPFNALESRLCIISNLIRASCHQKSGLANLFTWTRL